MGTQRAAFVVDHTGNAHIDDEAHDTRDPARNNLHACVCGYAVVAAAVVIGVRVPRAAGRRPASSKSFRCLNYLPELMLGVASLFANVAAALANTTRSEVPAIHCPSALSPGKHTINMELGGFSRSFEVRNALAN